MDGWIYSTLPSARTPKFQGVLFVVDSGESGGGLWLWVAMDAVGVGVIIETITVPGNLLGGSTPANDVVATILSVGMLMKYSFGEPLISEKIHSAVKKVLSEGFATKDIAQKNSIIVSTSEMGDKIANYVS